MIVGMRSPQRVERNAIIGDGQGLPAAQVQILQGHRSLRDHYSAGL